MSWFCYNRVNGLETLPDFDSLALCVQPRLHYVGATVPRLRASFLMQNESAYWSHSIQPGKDPQPKSGALSIPLLFVCVADTDFTYRSLAA